MKKGAIILLTSACIMLTGCSSVRNTLEQKMLTQVREKSDISSDTAYAQYQDYTARGDVVDGYYAPNGEAFAPVDDQNTETPSGIHITFALNNHLNVCYYYDPDCQIQIESNGCYLTPGSSIYAKVKIDSEAFTNQYAFSSFMIYEYNAEGKRSFIANVGLEDDGLLWSIPENFAGNDIVIEPLGRYEKRILSLRDYYYDSQSTQKRDLDFTWTVNGKSTKDSSMEINPVQPYLVSYQYDNETYFFISSDPSCYSYNDDDGIVYFKQAEPNDENVAYSVELKPYMTSEIRIAAKATYHQDGKADEKREKKEVFTASHLKYGDKIIIKGIDGEFSEDIIEYDKKLFVLHYDENNKICTLTVQENNGDFIFDPNEYSFKHGDIVFTYSGQIVTDKITLAKGRRIEYYAENVDEGYWLPDGEHTIIIGDAVETEASIREIQFYPKQEVTVNLPQPIYGGSITYSINDVKQSGSNVKTYCGTTIQMKLNAWDGWNKDQETASYTVSAQQFQTATIDGKDVDHAFEELPEHKPKLTVNLDKSIGTNMKFSVKTADGKKTDLAYGKGDGKCKTYEEEHIGTSEGITFMKLQGEIREGKVLKIAVEMMDENKNEIQEVYYMEDPSEDSSKVHIPIYQTSERTNALYYKSIDVTVSVVDRLIYQPSAVANAVVTVTAADVRDQPKLQTGNILDANRKVQVVIRPNNGYYLTGGKVKFDQYQSEMTFGQYMKDIQSIINKHPVKKIFTVALDTTDEIGTIEYTLDGKPADGKIQIREGQKLVMKYKITASGYQIKRDSKSILGLKLENPIASKTEKTITIEVSAALDGHTIHRPDYIQVEKEN